MLRRIVPAQVQIVDSAESTAKAVARCLNTAASGAVGHVSCFATDSVDKFRRLGGRFLGRPIEDIELIDIER